MCSVPMCRILVMKSFEIFFNWASERHSANSSCKTSLFFDAFRLTVIDFFREFYKFKVNTFIYKP